jgi:hypothetical protein
MSSRRLSSAVAGLVALSLMAASATAQGNEPTVVVLDMPSLPDQVRSRILIKTESMPEAVIAIRSAHVSAADLAEAFHVMHALRKEARKKSFPAGTFIRKDIQGASLRRLSEAEHGAYTRYLNLVKHSPQLDVPGLGTGRGFKVGMPQWP